MTTTYSYYYKPRPFLGSEIITKFRDLEQKEIVEKQDDVYAKNYVPKKYSKMSSEYGTPKPGTLTEKRAKKAAKHIQREMLYLCDVIQEYGRRSEDDNLIHITFGRLFNIYQFISDKVVGILLRARKHKMLDFEGEMLFQRRDDNVIITLFLEGEQIKAAINELTKSGEEDKDD